MRNTGVAPLVLQGDCKRAAPRLSGMVGVAPLVLQGDCKYYAIGHTSIAVSPPSFCRGKQSVLPLGWTLNPG